MWLEGSESRGLDFWRTIAFVLLALSPSAACSQTDRSMQALLHHTDGKTESAALLEVQAGAMKFLSQTKLIIPIDRVWRFGADSAILRGPYLLLKDGSRLAAPSVTGTVDQLTFSVDEIHPGLWDGKSLSLTDVRAILWKTPLGEQGLRTCLDLGSTVAADTLRLENGDSMVGEYRGIVQNDDSSAEEVLFSVRGAQSRIAVSRCISLQLADHSANPPLPASNAWKIAFRDGSRLCAQDLFVDARAAVWRAADGARWELPLGLFSKSCILIEPPRRGVVFLSDLKELSYRHLPLFGEAAPFRPARNAKNDPFRRAGAYREKGIGMWSNSRLSYALPQNATRFQAEICIDDAAGEQGSVRFRLLAQMKAGAASTIKDLYRSEIIRGGEDPTRVDVDLTGAANLILLVESADQGETLDVANWLDARFVISSPAP